MYWVSLPTWKGWSSSACVLLHPELVRAREAFEIALEEYAMLNQTQPSKNLKSKIFAAIDIESDQEHFSTEAGRADELGNE